jgi:hypothetical protein
MAKPIIKIRDTKLSSAVFEYDGQYGKNYQACVQRSYKKKDATEYTNEVINLYEDDLLKMANLCIQTYNHILALKYEQAKTTVPPADTESTPLPTEADDGIPF